MKASNWYKGNTGHHWHWIHLHCVLHPTPKTKRGGLLLGELSEKDTLYPPKHLEDEEMGFNNTFSSTSKSSARRVLVDAMAGRRKKTTTKRRRATKKKTFKRADQGIRCRIIHTFKSIWEAQCNQGQMANSEQIEILIEVYGAFFSSSFSFLCPALGFRLGGFWRILDQNLLQGTSCELFGLLNWVCLVNLCAAALRVFHRDDDSLGLLREGVNCYGA